MRRWRGFTLIELLLALLITALIATSSYSALSEVMQAREVYLEKSAELARLQRFFTVISRDIRQATTVANRAADGEYEDVLVVNDDADAVLVLNRRGWHNPQGALRSELQRVLYRFDGDTVVRGYWEAFDRVEQTAFRERVVLEGVRAISIQALPQQPFSDLERGWVEQWPSNEEVLPAALQVTVEFEALGEFRRVYELLPQG